MRDEGDETWRGATHYALLNPRSLAQCGIEGVRAGLVLLLSVPCKDKHRQAFRMPYNISSEGFFNKDRDQGVTLI